MNTPQTQYADWRSFALIVGCVAVLLPFVGTLLFAIVICVSAWPLYAGCWRRCAVAMRWRHSHVAGCWCCCCRTDEPARSGSLANGVELIICATLRPLIDNGLPTEPPAWLSGPALVGDSISTWAGLVESREELNKLLRQFSTPTQLALAQWRFWRRGTAATPAGHLLRFLHFPRRHGP